MLTPRLSVIIAAIAAAFEGASGAESPQTAPEEDVRAFRAFMESNTAKRGTVLAVYESRNEPGRFVVHVGYDFATGAWFKIFRGGVYGCDAEGRRYSGGEHEGGVAHSGEPPRVPPLENHLPMFGLAERPDVATEFRRIERTSEGGFRVQLHRPAYSPSPGFIATAFDGVFVVDHAGRVLTRGTSWDRALEKLEYVEGLPPGVNLVADRGAPKGAVLKRYEWFPEGRPELFELKAVEARAIEADTGRRTRPMLGYTLTTGPDGRVVATPTEATSVSPSTVRRGGMRAGDWALIGTGVVLVGVGGLAWWRRRG